MAVVKFRTCLAEKEFKAMERLKKKHFRGNRAATIAAGLELLKKKYGNK